MTGDLIFIYAIHTSIAKGTHYLKQYNVVLTILNYNDGQCTMEEVKTKAAAQSINMFVKNVSNNTWKSTL